MIDVRLRPLAEQDLVEQTRYYKSEPGPAVAERFFDAAIAGLQIVAGRPEGGSLRIGELCDIDGLRVRRLPGFPSGWFYFIRPGFIDVVRLLGFAQDLPAQLGDVD